MAPWLNASAADIPHSPARTGARQRRVARRATARAARISSSAASPPRTGEIASAIRIPNTPTGRQCSIPPQLTACTPPSTTAAPTSPPTSAWPELDGRPSRQVIRFQVTAAARPAPITSTVDVRRDGDDAADRVGDRGAEEQRPEHVEHRRRAAIACSGVAARVATSVAIALDASCSPFVTANPIANSTATTSGTSMGELYGPGRPRSARWCEGPRRTPPSSRIGCHNHQTACIGISQVALTQRPTRVERVTTLRSATESPPSVPPLQGLDADARVDRAVRLRSALVLRLGLLLVTCWWDAGGGGERSHLAGRRLTPNRNGPTPEANTHFRVCRDTRQGDEVVQEHPLSTHRAYGRFTL